MTEEKALTPVSLETARGLVARAVLTQGPDFVYLPEDCTDTNRVCLYVPMPADHPAVDTNLGPQDPRCQTACIVGVALGLAGYTFEVTDTDNFRVYARNKALPISQAATEYLMAVQSRQDGAGRTWGEAYRWAESRVAHITDWYDDEVPA